MGLKQKCVVFGAGERGTRIYKKLTNFFEVAAYSDNNATLWGDEINGVKILPPSELPKFIEETSAVIFIANELHYLDIAKQLNGLGLTYYNCENYMCYELDNGVWYPVSFGKPTAYKKPEKSKFAVLFVQDKPCTRTNKIAEVLKRKGVLTYAAYTATPSDAGERAYIKEFPFWTYGELLDFVNESEFDIVHCSNEPDILVNMLIHSNKKIVHDCHDIVSVSKKSYHAAEVALEYIANTQADGAIYPTERVRDILIRKCDGGLEKTLVLGNYPLSSFGQVERLPKLSKKDGEIHCVYEGFIVDKSHSENVEYRFFEPIFVQLSQLGVHVHIYSYTALEYLKQLDRDNRNIHYEGNFSGAALVTEMTRYDLGLLMYLQTDTTYMELASPNKMTEYLAAGLPVVSNIKSFVDILTLNNCGGALDLDDSNVISQMRKYMQLSIPPDFCDMHGFTMDSNADRILEFYKKVLEQ